VASNWCSMWLKICSSHAAGARRQTSKCTANLAREGALLTRFCNPPAWCLCEASSKKPLCCKDFPAALERLDLNLYTFCGLKNLDQLSSELTRVDSARPKKFIFENGAGFRR